MAREYPVPAARDLMRRSDARALAQARPTWWRWPELQGSRGSFDPGRASLWHERRAVRPAPATSAAGAVADFADELFLRFAHAVLLVLLAVPAAVAGLVVLAALALQRKPLPLGEEAEFYGDDWPVE